MRRLRLLCLVALLATPAHADRLKAGDWLFGFGLGYASAPGLFLASPHLERVIQGSWMLGMLAQAGFGANDALFAISATGRFQIGDHPRLRPTLEAGLGFATASRTYNATLGFEIHGGMGIEYLWDSGLAIGTMVRANFAPPLHDFFLTWAIANARFLF
ncbi:hypothetical protein K2X33_09540 [bacterium]|nr:hypothetical protein [bacterium]